MLSGIRAGRVYNKTRGPEGPDLRFDVPSHGVSMGDVLQLPSPAAIVFRVRISGAAGQRVDVIRTGTVHVLGPDPLASNDETLTVTLNVSAGDWVRVNVRDAAGITLMGNPIYLR